MRTTRHAFALALLVSVASAGGLRAQFPTDTLDARGVVARFRATKSAAAATRFLRQEGLRHSTRELDEVADSLVAIAVSYRRGDPLASLGAAQQALGALARSALPGAISELTQKRAERGLPPPIPYPHAFEKLVEVFRRGQSVGTRGGALWQLTQLGDTARAVAFLTDVAKTNDPLAPAAIRYLSMDTGKAGFAALRRLYQTDAVVHWQAREHLQALAAVRGWKR